ncbi:MAG: glycosyltransferase family 4 protein [bacterium JZ-2024 1]
MHHIALELSPVAHGMGIGRYARELTLELVKHNTDIQWWGFTRKKLPEDFRFSPALRYGIRLYHLPSHRIWYEQALLPIFLKKNCISLFFSPDFTLPLFAPSSCVVTIHDLSFLDDPDTLSPPARKLYSTFVPLSIRKARAVIADSHFTADRIQFWFPGSRPYVIYPGVSPVFFQPPASPHLPFPEPYLFFCGLIEKRKNPEILLYLSEILKKENKDIRIVVVGKTGYGYQDFPRACQAYHIHYLPEVSEEHLKNLYASALATLFLSRYEGFGFPLLEAMACGSPVIAFSIPIVRELAGDCALLAGSFQDFLNCVFSLLEDKNLQRTLSEKGKIIASRFTWTLTAQKLLSIFSHFLS